ncbi:hypothetical protein QGM71_17590 [Virgibacillus sp. C22-A2]|uniref:Swt1-like HEPN domain-containing protein n=1 Tax=Virgibacillus tibetensis TaxID=3042313 RepID=A0ABU6KJJ5_9BACI|nr:hypothetical protein [Virgibacillus sp. C22-A2]
MELEFMKNAYGLLYEVENKLHYTIESVMRNEYGIAWFINGPKAMKYLPYRKGLKFFNYYELLALMRGYPCFTNYFSKIIFISLHETIPIRNKIAHCHVISQDEYDLLQSVNDYLSKEVNI